MGKVVIHQPSALVYANRGVTDLWAKRRRCVQMLVQRGDTDLMKVARTIPGSVQALAMQVDSVLRAPQYVTHASSACTKADLRHLLVCSAQKVKFPGMTPDTQVPQDAIPNPTSGA